MQTRTRNPFTTIHTEGALLPSDLLQRVLAYNKDIPGLTPEGYHLSGEKLNEAINRSWNRLQGAWAAFKTSRGRLGEGDAGTGLTRERWLLPLFDELDYGRLQIAKGLEIDGKPYAISHMWANVPIHLIGCGVDLEKRSAGVVGASKASPHSLLQEYLNRSPEAQWGLVSNGLRLRVLRDNATLTRQAFLEFDLEAMFEGEVYADFALLWLVCHQSRFENQGMGNSELGVGTTPRSPLPTAECILEQWSKLSQEQGTRALEYLRKGVEQAIAALGSGFLRAPANQKLRADLRSGALSTHDYYRQLLRLVYRLIFLFVAEDRDLLFDPASTPKARERYLKYYSLQRLRRLASLTRGSRHPDLYEALKVVMRLLAGVSLPTPNSQPPTPYSLALPILGGFLFSEQALPDLEPAELANESLLAAIRCLTTMDEGQTRRAVDYKNMGARELGSVYESLLELHATVNTDSAQFELLSVAGNERKTTGSFFTHEDLINELLNSALDPVIAQALAQAGSSIEKQIAALLALNLIDPACGSGHFLVAGAHRLARRLAQVRTGEGEPTPDAMRAALREVISHCIYGVDINPMSVELCKVSLWLEALEPGKPLSFLDAHIQCGDSLVGVSPNLDISEIPDEAFNPAFGDDKATASAMKKRNKRERGGQFGLFGSMRAENSTEETQHWLAEYAAKVDAMPEESAEQVQVKTSAYSEMQSAEKFNQFELENNLWTAAFFWQIPQCDAESLLAPTQQALVALRGGNTLKPALLDKVNQLAKDLNFLHWKLVFPQVFAGPDPGFDCVLGNPPWEMLQLEEQSFFASREPRIATLPGEFRKKAIVDLINTNPALAIIFEEAKHLADAKNKFLRESLRYTLTAVGKMNTYAIFAEDCRNLISTVGRVGIILPTGIATDDTTKIFFGDLVEKRTISTLFDFENREKVFFPAVDSRMKFCLLTLTGAPVEQSEFAFFTTDVNQLHNVHRRFAFAPSEIPLFNPNTHTVPIFRTRSDAELSKKIYLQFPVLINDAVGQNTWQVRFKQGLFNMTTDSGLFSQEKLDGFLPLYEGKMFSFYDHRFASVVRVSENLFRQNQPVLTANEEYKDPRYSPTPLSWVSQKEVEKQLEGYSYKWFIGFKNITASTNERTAIFTILPYAAIGNVVQLVFFEANRSVNLQMCFLANMNSMIFDYCVRQKIGGLHLTFSCLNQIPVLLPSSFTSSDIAYTAPRVLELVYTAYDLKPFAEDMWKDALTLPSPEGRGFKQLPSPAGGRAGDEGALRNADETPTLTTYNRISPEFLQRCRDLRKNATKAEIVLWAVLRDRQLGDLKFRRQHPCQGYILDFYCHEKQLAIELDGGGHAEPDQAEYDQERTRILNEQGIRVLRFWNKDVLNNLEGVAQEILTKAEETGAVPSYPNLSPMQLLILRQWEDNHGQKLDLAGMDVDSALFLPPFKWDEERRALLRAELDAYYAKLYGLTRDELRYILDPKEVYGEDFPGETFRVLKDKEIRLYGEYRTRRLVLEAWDKLEGVQVSGYQASAEPIPDNGLSSTTGGLSTATSGLSSATGGIARATDGLSSPTSRQPSITGGLSSPASAQLSVTGGLSAVTGGLSFVAKEVKPDEDNPAQPSFSDFGLYECLSCGKRLMGFDQGKHIKQVHAGQPVEWKKIR